MTVIISKIETIKVETKKEIKVKTKKLTTIKSFKKLLSKIDFSAEDVPVNNMERLLKLFTSLKGEKLNKHEISVIKELLEK